MSEISPDRFILNRNNKSLILWTVLLYILYTVLYSQLDAGEQAPIHNDDTFFTLKKMIII